MKYFFYRLLPPRPSFPADATEGELAIMEQHAAYWGARMEEGRVVALGPVFDPRGTYGIALLTLTDDDDPEELVRRDPAIASREGFGYEIFTMPQLVYRTAPGT